MTNAEINIAIAEYCGWQILEPEVHPCIIYHWAIRPDGSKRISPDYCNDLNEMHEVEKTLKDPIQQSFYAEYLGDDYICTAFLHDVIEDTSITKEYLLEQGIPTKIVDAVVVLTKTDHIDYDDYIQNVRTNEIAKAVKIADMLSNLTDNPTTNQIKKYSKGLYILTRD